MNSSASAIMDVQQFSLSLRGPAQRLPFSSGLLERIEHVDYKGFGSGEQWKIVREGPDRHSSY